MSNRITAPVPVQRTGPVDHPTWCDPNTCTANDVNVLHKARIDRFKSSNDDVLVDIVRYRMDEISSWLPGPEVGRPHLLLSLTNLISSREVAGHQVPIEAEVSLAVVDARRLAAALLNGADRIEQQAGYQPAQGLTDDGLAQLRADADAALDRLAEFVAGGAR